LDQIDITTTDVIAELDPDLTVAECFDVAMPQRLTELFGNSLGERLV